MTDMSIVPTEGVTNPGLPPKMLVNYVRKEQAEALPPPANLTGWQGWVRENLFSGPFNIAMTILAAFLIYWIFAPLISFTLIDAVWSGTDREACIITPARPVVGACWPFVFERFEYFIYGSYPIAERWRPTLFFVLLIVFGRLAARPRPAGARRRDHGRPARRSLARVLHDGLGRPERLAVPAAHRRRRRRGALDRRRAQGSRGLLLLPDHALRQLLAADRRIAGLCPDRRRPHRLDGITSS